MLAGETDTAPNAIRSLQVATAFWLRTLGTAQDNELGLASFINLLVPITNTLYFECPEQTGKVFCSNGELIRGLFDCKSPILWQRVGLHRNISLVYFSEVSAQVRIHISWLEHALALAFDSMYNHGHKLSDMITKPIETIAGIEKVDWL